MFVDPWGLAPGDHFKSRDEAAADFGRYAAMLSYKLEEELAAAIYEEVDGGETYYYYDEPRNNLKSHEERAINFYIKWIKTPVAIVHTHGIYDVSTDNTKEVFSSPGNVASQKDETSDSYFSDLWNLDYYLVSPAGTLLLYTAGSGDYNGKKVNYNRGSYDGKVVDCKNSKGIPKDPRYEVAKTVFGTLLRGRFKNNTDMDFVNARLEYSSWNEAIEYLKESEGK